MDLFERETAVFLGLMIPFLGLLVPGLVLIVISLSHRIHPTHMPAEPVRSHEAATHAFAETSLAGAIELPASPGELTWQAEALRESDIFEGLTDDELQLVVQIAIHRKVTRGTRLAAAGSRGHDLFAIIRGEIRLLSHPPEEHLVRVARAGETVPLAAIIDPPVVVTTAEAATDCEVLAIPRQPLIDLLEVNQAMGYQVYRAVARSFEHRYRHTLDHPVDTQLGNTGDQT
jgi:hypothetical protein